MNIRFDSTIVSILELDRITGQQVTVPVPTSHLLSLVLPAGTGRLFKYNEGNFIIAAVPEPSTFGLTLLGSLLFRLLPPNIRIRRV